MTWVKGQSGNPKGRAVGVRERITNAFLVALERDWREHGAEAIADARERDPVGYLRVVVKLLPRDITLRTEPGPTFMDALRAVDAVRRELEARRASAAVVEVQTLPAPDCANRGR